MEAGTPAFHAQASGSSPSSTSDQLLTEACPGRQQMTARLLETLPTTGKPGRSPGFGFGSTLSKHWRVSQHMGDLSLPVSVFQREQK